MDDEHKEDGWDAIGEEKGSCVCIFFKDGLFMVIIVMSDDVELVEK